MYRIILASIVACFAVPAQADNLKLECPSMYDVAKEQRQIRASGAGQVVRSSKHELRVTAHGETLKFLDVAPYADDYGGVWHQFCDRKDGFILLAYVSDDLHSGKLINEATGKVTPAGLSVEFSRDRRAYFAYQQPDGLDGLVWLIYALDGRQSWSGLSYIPHVSNSGWMTAQLSEPTWAPDGRFSALAQCISKTTIPAWKVTLTKNNDGKWDWRPKNRACPNT